MKVLLPMVWLHCALARSGSIASISTAQLCSSALEDTNREIKAYQEDPALNEKTTQMREIAARINKAIIDKDIVIEQDGSITINYWDDEDD